jgi:aspartate aminotransferase-like enzyme
MSPVREERFFLPGPTEIHPDVAAAMLRPMIGHRGAEFRALFARLQTGLRDVFATKRTVVIVSSSSTGLMEMAVRSAPPGRVLSMVNGGFSERFDEIARACGREVDRLDVEWGRAHDLDDVERALKAQRYSAVTVVHSETSTGVLTDVAAVTRMAHANGAVALIDSVSLAGGGRCEADAWELDIVFTGSQKALALPPGLAFGAADDALIASAADQAARGRYFDLVEYAEAAAKNETPSTPAISLLYALDMQLERIAKETMPVRIGRHAAMANTVYEWVDEVGRDGLDVSILAPPGSRAPTVTVLTLPERIETAHVLHSMRARGYTIAAGYGPLAAASVRIGHMGDHTVEGVSGCLAALRDSLEALRKRPAGAF